MRERIALFERYTLPSVERQTNKDFLWFILLDEERCRPFPGLVERIERAGYVPLFCEHLDVAIPRILDHAATLGSFDHIATSRLDSDDVLHPEYIADVKASSSASPTPPISSISFSSLSQRRVPTNMECGLIGASLRRS